MGYCQGYQRRGQARTQALPLLSWFFGYFPPAVAKVYIVSFRSNDDRRPSKFIVLADNMKSAINMAWEHGGADFQARFDKTTAQAQEMKEGALRGFFHDRIDVYGFFGSLAVAFVSAAGAATGFTITVIVKTAFCCLKTVTIPLGGDALTASMIRNFPPPKSRPNPILESLDLASSPVASLGN